jgi:hypothetical protein
MQSPWSSRVSEKGSCVASVWSQPEAGWRGGRPSREDPRVIEEIHELFLVSSTDSIDIFNVCNCTVHAWN